EDRYSTPMQVVAALEPFLDDGAIVGRDDSTGQWSSDGSKSGSGSRSGSGVSGDEPGGPASVGDVTVTSTSGSGADPTRPDGERVLAATAASAARGSAARPSAPGVATAVADPSGSSGGDLDDRGGPLLTPVDGVPPQGSGLPIQVDLGPEPPLRPSA